MKVNRSDALRCPTSEQVADFRKALEDGDAVMQAFQHSSEPETMDPATFKAGLVAARELAARFGRPAPTVLSQRDVPGLTVGVVPLLAGEGVKGISVGSNDGSPAPMVPSTVDCYHGYQQVRTPFVWKDLR